MDLNNCIICSSTKDLNTSINITIEDEKYTIHLCDEHGEETTPKAAREALNNRLGAIKEVMAQAASLGIEILDPKAKSNSSSIVIAKDKKTYICECGKICTSKSGLTIHKKSCKLLQDSQLQPQQQPQIQAQEPNEFVGIRGVSGEVEGGSQSLEGYQTINVDEIVNKIAVLQEEPVTVKPTQNLVEVQEITSRSGRTIILPKVQEGNIGTTNVKYEDSGGDKALQDRFKSQAAESRSMSNEQWHGKGSYDKMSEVACTLCRGTGISRIGQKQCAKCGGSGILSLST